MATFYFNSVANNMRDILPQERQNWRQEMFEVDEVGFCSCLKLWFTCVYVFLMSSLGHLGRRGEGGDRAQRGWQRGRGVDAQVGHERQLDPGSIKINCNCNL